MDDRVLNERLALLLGWEWVVHKPDQDSAHPGHRFLTEDYDAVSWYCDRATGDEPLFEQRDTPDFLNDWTRFPDLLAFVRDQPMDVVNDIEQFLWDCDDLPFVYRSYSDEPQWLWDITPRILGMSILEVCGSEVEA